MDQRSDVSFLKKSRGFSLIEILITLSIVSVGLLGILAAQLKSVQQSNAIAQRYTAMAAVKEMTNRLKANFVEARAFQSYATTSNSYSCYSGYPEVCSRTAASSAYNVGTLSNSTGANNNNYCTSNYCTPTQLANSDLSEMYNTILPSNATMKVCLDNTVYTSTNPTSAGCSCNSTPLSVTQYTSGDTSASFQKTAAVYCVSIQWADSTSTPTNPFQYYLLTVRP